MTKLEQAKKFIFTLLEFIPTKTLNNKNMVIIKDNQARVTLQEYINENLKEIWDIEIVWED